MASNTLNNPPHEKGQSTRLRREVFVAVRSITTAVYRMDDVVDIDHAGLAHDVFEFRQTS